jgi:hypothetical protein
MRSISRLLVLNVLLSPLCYATHYRGGEIIATHVTGQTYKIKARMYIDINYGAGSDPLLPLQICMGDGNTIDVPRVSSQPLPNDGTIGVQEFEGTYTYGSSGSFQISTSPEKRSLNYTNFTQTDGHPALIWTVINTQQGNSTPVLPYLNFQAGVRQVFTIDLKPAVPDQDSISVVVQRISRISPGTCSVRMKEQNYQFPNEISSSGTFRVEPALKQLVWRAPEMVGVYIYAMVVLEWRDGIAISESYREGSIYVTDRPGPTVEVPPYQSAEYGNPITSIPKVSSPEISLIIDAYPVPAEHHVTVRAYSKQKAIVKLQLVDIRGRIIQEKATINPETSILEEFDMRKLPPGIYFIKASNSTDIVSQKLIH